MPPADSLKRAAAQKALGFVKDGAKLGLGTGTTAEAFLELLAAKIKTGLTVTGVPTSERTAARAKALRIPLSTLDELGQLDLTVDGCDEADPALNLIKGAGGALLKEKIVAASSQSLIVIADESKQVDHLGRAPLPIEIVAFGQPSTVSRIRNVLGGLGYADAQPKLRLKDGAPFKTDCGNLIYDCVLGKITDPAMLALALGAVPGVVEHGLFVRMAALLVVARPDGIDLIKRPESRA